MPLNMTKLNLIAAEWDPAPFLRASDQAMAMQQLPTTQPDLAGGAPQGAPPGVGAPGDWASLMGGAPAEGGAPGANSMGATGLEMMKPQQGAVPNAPAVAPRKGPSPQFPGIPQIGKVPTLKDLLGGR